MIFATSASIALVALISRILLVGEFFRAWVFIPLLMLGALFNSIATFLGAFYSAALNSRLLLRSTFVGAFINVALSITLTWLFGAWGSVIGSAASNFAIMTLRMVECRRFITINYLDWRLSLAASLLSVQAIGASFGNLRFVTWSGIVPFGLALLILVSLWNHIHNRTPARAS